MFSSAAFNTSAFNPSAYRFDDTSPPDEVVGIRFVRTTRRGRSFIFSGALLLSASLFAVSAFMPDRLQEQGPLIDRVRIVRRERGM